MKTEIVKSRYDKYYYDGNDISVTTISRDELQNIDRSSVDHFLAVDLGICEFRTEDGQWVKKKLLNKSIGTLSLKIMEAARCEPGVFFSPKGIAELTQIYSLIEPNNLSARWRALRLFHEEDNKHQNFFLSKRAGGPGYAWNPDKSYIEIVRIGIKQESN